jgi:glucose/arabinose dehydrogenase
MGSLFTAVRRPLSAAAGSLLIVAVAGLAGVAALLMPPADRRYTVAVIAAEPQPPAAKPAEAAAAPAPQPTEFECRWTDKPVEITGEGTDPAWKDAAVIDNFRLPWLGKNVRPARTATKARLLWDREYLYFLAEMEDHDLFADIKQHNGQLWDNDVFELFLKPADDKPGYYEFQVNAAGAVLDVFLPRRGAGGFPRFKNDGGFDVTAKVKLRGTLNDWRDRDEGWTVEGRIPWTDFLRTGGRPAVDERWKFALCRYDYSVDFEGPELSTCAPLSQLSFHRHEDYAALVFRGPPDRPAKPYGLSKREPLTTCKVVGSPDPPLPYRTRRVYPDLKLNFPIIVRHQPGSDRLLFIAAPWPYAPTTLYRFRDDPKAGSGSPGREVETLFKFEPNAIAVDIAFHPKFAENGYFYVGCNDWKRTKVLRYTMERTEPYRVVAGSETLIIDWPSDGHNGAALAFAPDGLLYVTSGDGTSDSDKNLMGQGLDHRLSKVLRIDVDHPDAGSGRPYSVPSDNPFVDVKGAAPETWAYGLRNPWRIAIDPKTGHVWVGNNGQDLWEQVYFVRKGENYGWSVTEGSHPFYPNRKAGPTPIAKPTLEHPHSEARSLTGGLVYHGERLPELRGAYLYGDYSTGKVWAAKHDGQKVVWHKLIADTRMAITGFGLDPRGEILICDFRGKDGGGLYTLEPTPADAPTEPFPTRLSQSGLFRSVKDHAMAAGVIPYSVNSPLWSDGAYKARWMAPPGADSRIDYTRWRGFNFPEGTVLVKSFALEAEEGRPETRRWIETRFMHKRGGEWYGYSYAWNEDGTDGVLVESGGADREYAVRVAKSAEHPDGVRRQKWHYPSRTECMVCHSRAANFVLGLSEAQLNRDHDYGSGPGAVPGGCVDNQLRTLEKLGVLNVDSTKELRNALKGRLSGQGLSGKDLDAEMHKRADTRMQREPVPSTLLPVPPERLNRLPDPMDPTQPLEARAKSYLQSNCAHCHVEAGGGNAMITLEYSTALKDMRLVDAKPLHHTFDLPDARLVAPGRPESSVLLKRISDREKGHMPPLATGMVDREAVKLMTEWIRTVKPPDPMPAKPAEPGTASAKP